MVMKIVFHIIMRLQMKSLRRYLTIIRLVKVAVRTEPCGHLVICYISSAHFQMRSIDLAVTNMGICHSAAGVQWVQMFYISSHNNVGLELDKDLLAHIVIYRSHSLGSHSHNVWESVLLRSSNIFSGLQPLCHCINIPL